MKIFTTAKVFIALLIICFVTFIYFWKFYEQAPNYNYEKITPTSLTQKTSVTGRVKPIDNTNLTFEQSGKISNVLVKVGDHVKANTPLVTMNSAELNAQLQEAIANHNLTKIQLQELENGTQQEQITVKESIVDSSQTNLENSKNNLNLQIETSFLTAKTIVRTTIGNLTNNPADPRSKIIFQANDYNRLNNLQNDKFYLNQMINDWERYLQENPDLIESNQVAKKNLAQLQKYVEDLIYLTPRFTSRTTEGTAKLTTWKTEMSATQTSINSLISGLNIAYNDILAKEKLTKVSSQELNLTTSDTRPEQIAMQKARIQGSQARINQIQALINKTVLKAPFDGIITKMDAKKGEVISLATTKEILVSMISENYEIELYVPEIDIAKIEIGDPVLIRFDAFDDHEFPSNVKFIEPAETENQGVVYYQVKIEVNPDEIPLEIRSGMSVDVDIITDTKENVIKIPQRRVIRDNGDKLVRILIPNETGFDESEIKVETGLRDADGNVEIINGLKEGDLLLMESFTESKLK